MKSVWICLALTLLLQTTAAIAQKAYDPGASDTEIKIGNIAPFSGGASVYGSLARVEGAYFKMVNDRGGINGRKISFISYDDAYSPPKTFEQARKLVESDEVLLLFGVLGTPPNAAIQRYLEGKKVPNLFLSAAATRWALPKRFPWTMPFPAPYQGEIRLYARYLLKNKPDAKIGVLYPNDDYGKDYLSGLKEGLGAKAATMLAAEESFENAEPTIESHIVKLKASGADVIMLIGLSKAMSQAIRKIGELGWKPTIFLMYGSASINGVIRPAGFEFSQGIISSGYSKDGSDPQWRDDSDFRQWSEFLDKYNGGADKDNGFGVTGFVQARVLEQVLRQCGDNLTRQNVMKQAANLRDFVPGMLLPGVKINTSPDDYWPVEQMRLMRFKGESWEYFGELEDASGPR
ncbi:ABC transporter substrate-binding protein [Bradyrhizobium liaoningense]